MPRLPGSQQGPKVNPQAGERTIQVRTETGIQLGSGRNLIGASYLIKTPLFLRGCKAWLAEQIAYISGNRLECTAMAISILGGFFVPQLDPVHRGIGFLLRGISNPLWIWYGIRTGKKGIALLFIGCRI